VTGERWLNEGLVVCALLSHRDNDLTTKCRIRLQQLEGAGQGFILPPPFLPRIPALFFFRSGLTGGEGWGEPREEGQCVGHSLAALPQRECRLSDSHPPPTMTVPPARGKHEREYIIQGEAYQRTASASPVSMT
jgi:hypothetical protein